MAEKKAKKGGSGSKPTKPKRKKGGFPWAVLGVAFLVLLSGIIYLSWEKTPDESDVKDKKRVTERPKEKPKEKHKETFKEKPKEQYAKPKEQPKEQPKERPDKQAKVQPPAQKPVDSHKIDYRPKIAIIIDDLGSSKKIDDEVLSIDAPLTLSVFPLHPDSRNIAEKAGSNGKEVMLHLPMEPHDYPQTDPGNGALFTSMDDISIITQLYEDINSVPGIKGVNNHMGSKFTEDSKRMRTVLKQVRERGLYFIDSKTSPQSNSDKMAKEMGLKAGARDVFLDNEQEEGYILSQIEELKKIARATGSAIGIGHPHPATVVALKKAIPGMGKEFEIVPASRLVK